MGLRLQSRDQEPIFTCVVACCRGQRRHAQEVGEQSATGPQRLDLQPPTRLGAPLRAVVGWVLVAVHVAAIKVALRWPTVPLLLRGRAPILVTLWWPSPLIILWGPVPALLWHRGRPVALCLWGTIVVLPLRGTGIDRGRRCVAVGVVVVGRWSSVLQQKAEGESEAGRRRETRDSDTRRAWQLYDAGFAAFT